MQCKGRYCNESKEIKFPIQSGYFTERRCDGIATSNKIDNELCDRCSIQKNAGFRYKNQQSYYQGKIDEPYFENSWLFGSPRYLKYAALPGNMPTADAIDYAEAAQKRVREGDKMKAAAEAEKSVKKRKINPDKKITLPKSKEEVKKAGGHIQISRSVAVESNEPPIEALDMIKVTLKKFEIDDIVYWIEPSQSSVYEVLEHAAVGKQIGRWDAEKKKLVKIFRTTNTESKK